VIAVAAAGQRPVFAYDPRPCHQHSHDHRSAALIMLVLDRFPLLIWLGAMLLGWIAGDVIASDPADQPLLHRCWMGR